MQINHKAKSKMKKFLILIPVLLMLNGCATSKLANLAKQLKGDAASVRFTVHTIYGTVDFIRTNPMTNSLPYSVTTDGTITVKTQ